VFLAVFVFFQCGIRVPAIVRWPGHVPAGRVDQESVWAAVDWLPTVCSLARVTVGNYRPDGLDVSGVWFGGTRPCDRELVWGLMPERMALRDGDWKLDEYRDEVSLFNLAVDPYENQNLAELQPERTTQMRARLAEYRAELKEAQSRGAEAAQQLPESVGKTSGRRKKATNRKSR